MKSEYIDVWYTDGVEIKGKHKAIDLPFKRACARALIIRKADGAILGTLHRKGGRLAPPGGSIEDGESSAQAVIRELSEENILLVGPDPNWGERVAVDYYDGYHELSVWHVFQVEDVSIGESEENIESRWVQQDEDVWYPHMHEKIILTINRFLPELANKKLVIC